jgi:hypothetical protein
MRLKQSRIGSSLYVDREHGNRYCKATLEIAIKCMIRLETLLRFCIQLEEVAEQSKVASE